MVEYNSTKEPKKQNYKKKKPYLQDNSSQIDHQGPHEHIVHSINYAYAQIQEWVYDMPTAASPVDLELEFRLTSLFLPCWDESMTSRSI